MGMSIILSSFLDYIGKAKKRAYNISVTIILNIGLNIILIPRYGATGAAIATSVSYLPYVILNWLEVRKIFIKIKS
jgi:O-antigen/teichoic acid export membrane protein